MRQIGKKMVAVLLTLCALSILAFGTAQAMSSGASKPRASMCHQCIAACGVLGGVQGPHGQCTCCLPPAN